VGGDAFDRTFRFRASGFFDKLLIWNI